MKQGNEEASVLLRSHKKSDDVKSSYKGEIDSIVRHAESAHLCQPTMPLNYVIRPLKW